jgi:Na+/H+ ion antiporter subunit
MWAREATDRRRILPSGAGRAAALWVVWAAALFVFYLGLVDTRWPPELALGAILAVAGASVAVSIRSARDLRASPPPGWPLLLLSFASRLVTETVVVAGALLRALAGRRERGRFFTLPFSREGGEAGAGRRAFAESVGSLGPNTIVVGVDANRHLMLVHQLVRRDPDMSGLR